MARPGPSDRESSQTLFVSGRRVNTAWLQQQLQQRGPAIRQRVKAAFADMPFIKQFHKEMVLGTSPAYTLASPSEQFYQLPLLLQVEPNMPPFRYDVLGEEPGIRLLRILPARDGRENFVECEMQTFTTPSIPNYDCLSYSWGEDRLTKFPISINGFALDVLRTLATFLVQAQQRDQSSPWIWIDAICIDQENTKERNHFVSIMHDIYADADRVIISLGAGNVKLEGAVGEYKRFVEEYGILEQSQLSFEDTQHIQTGRQMLESFSSLLNHPYWCRAWILQEASVPLGRSADGRHGSCEVWYGKARLPMESMLAAMKVVDFVMVRTQRESPNLPLRTTAGSQVQLQLVRHTRQLALSQKTLPLDMPSLLSHARERRAFDPRDRLYALRSLSSTSMGFQVNYTASPEAIYRDFAVHCIRHSETLDILGFARGLHCGELVSLPSWVPDWTDTSVPEPLPKLKLGSILPEGADKTAYEIGRTLTVAEMEQDFQDRLHGPTPTGFERARVYNADGNKDCIAELSPCGGQLRIQAFRFDKVTRLLDEVVSSREPFFRQLIPEDFDLRAPYLTGGTYLGALRHTLCADVMPGFRTANRGEYVSWPEDGDMLEMFTRNAYEQIVRSGTDIASARVSSRVYDTLPKLVRWLSARRLFTTERGFIGLGPKGMEADDCVVLAQGSQVPMIIRSRLEGDLFVGEAYVHGIMDGEGVAGEEAAFRSLVLS